jgi:hypothetical protein
MDRQGIDSNGVKTPLAVVPASITFLGMNLLVILIALMLLPGGGWILSRRIARRRRCVWTHPTCCLVVFLTRWPNAQIALREGIRAESRPALQGEKRS